IVREVCLGSSDERGSYNFPLPLVAGGRFDGDEPPLFDEDIRLAQGRFLVSDGVGSVDINFPRGDGGLGPVVYEPVQKISLKIFPGEYFEYFGYMATVG